MKSAFVKCAYSVLLFGCVFAARVGCAADAPDRNVQAIIDTHAHIMRGGRGNAAVIVSQAVRPMDELRIATTILLPPPRPPGRPGYGRTELERIVREYPNRFAFISGGESLNPMIHNVGPEAVTLEHITRLRDEATAIVDSGAIGFGELTAEHFSSGRGNHPYESTRPDHPLLLALADIAAKSGLPIDLHMEAVPQDMPMPDRRRKGMNPHRLKENISGLERLLAHNRGARIVWAHCGWDLTGERTPTLMRTLLGRHPNLFMSIKLDPSSGRRNSPFAADGSLSPEWLDLFRDFSDRFVIGSDQFFDESANRLSMVRQFVDALPPDIAPRIARENARSIYRLKTKTE